MIGVSSEQSRSQFKCIHSAAAADCCCCRFVWMLLLLFCFSLCYEDTVCGFMTDYLDSIYYMHSVRCCTTYEYVFVFACHVLL